MLRTCLLLCAALAVAHSSAASADDQAVRLRELLEKNSGAVVTLSMVVKAHLPGGATQPASETHFTAKGVVVDASGLVMMSNLSFNPGRMVGLFGRGGGDGAPTLVPDQIKVAVGNTDKEYTGFLAATDTKLDLAFVQMEGLGQDKLQTVDFSKAADPSVGDSVVAVDRLDKGFDYSPVLRTGRVLGAISRPRRAWMLSPALSGLGLPVFADTGQLLGALVDVMPPTTDEGDDATGMGMFMRMMSGGGVTQGITFLVPGAQVQAVIPLAMQRAATMLADRAKHPPLPQSPPKSDRPKPAAGKTG